MKLVRILPLAMVLLIGSHGRAEDGGGRALTAAEIDALLAEDEDEPIDELVFLLSQDPAGFATAEDTALAEIYQEGFDQAAAKLAVEEATSPGLDFSVSATLTSGYQTNVTLSAFNSQDSAFVGGAINAFVTTDPLADWLGRAIGFYQRTSFIELPDIDDEVFAFASLQGERRWTGEALGIEAEYVYLDQFFDASTSNIIVANQRLQVHEYTFMAYWNRDLADDWFLECTLGVERTEVLASNDDLTTPYAEAELVWFIDPARKTLLETYAQLAYQIYDERLAREGDGTPFGGEVRLIQGEIGVLYQWKWDAIPQATFEIDVDGRTQWDRRGGFYQNTLARVAGEVRYDIDTLEARVFSGYYWRNYPERNGLGNPPVVSTWSTTLNAGMALTYPITDWAEAELTYEFDQSQSDNPSSEYTAHTASFSMNFTF